MVLFFSALKLEIILALSNLDHGKMSISHQWHKKFAPQKHQQWFLERLTCYRPIQRKIKLQKRLLVCWGTHQRWSHKITHKLKALNLVWEGRNTLFLFCTFFFFHVKVFCYSALEFFMTLSDWGWLDGTHRETNLKQNAATPNFAQENQAIKRQKLEGGKSRQVNSCYAFSISYLPHFSGLFHLNVYFFTF